MISHSSILQFTLLLLISNNLAVTLPVCPPALWNNHIYIASNDYHTLAPLNCKVYCYRKVMGMVIDNNNNDIHEKKDRFIHAKIYIDFEYIDYDFFFWFKWCQFWIIRPPIHPFPCKGVELAFRGGVTNKSFLTSFKTANTNICYANYLSTPDTLLNYTRHWDQNEQNSRVSEILSLLSASLRRV